ncbi:DNA-processing protein DprA [Hydrogenophaga sp.]|uniref:DNA-processing protein DprA n=1 Tax=Hydrogenophaga sp. TaxID=1904254 RepID=UPI003F72C92E
MTESDVVVAVATLGLIRAKRLTLSAATDLLSRIRSELDHPISIDAVLDLVKTPRALVNGSVADAQRDIDRGLALDVWPIPISSEKYPFSLRGIADAPPLLFVRGDQSVLAKVPGVAVVGTRKASAHGLVIATRVSQYLSERGWSVVSGLALGIDAAAHEGALLGKTPTIAVLAHGLEIAHPTANRPLAQRILEAGGVWVSEHPVGVKAMPANFVLRNRIQVGLSCASIIVEGEEQSGSKTQADFCLRNRRLLFAVLPEVGSNVATVSELPRMLVKVRGATPIYSKNDYPSVLVQVERAAKVLGQPGA